MRWKIVQSNVKIVYVRYEVLWRVVKAAATDAARRHLPATHCFRYPDHSTAAVPKAWFTVTDKLARKAGMVALTNNTDALPQNEKNKSL